MIESEILEAAGPEPVKDDGTGYITKEWREWESRVAERRLRKSWAGPVWEASQPTAEEIEAIDAAEAAVAAAESVLEAERQRFGTSLARDDMDGGYREAEVLAERAIAHRHEVRAWADWQAHRRLLGALELQDESDPE
jgi:hypothetical protein